MHKALLVTALALGVVGCAAPGTAPDVRDLSMSRAATESDSVTVEVGDTLYGIAWRQNMDFRELARLNGIAPPYRLQPGQALRLDGDAPTSGGVNDSSEDAAAASVASTAAATGDEFPDWLTPDTQAIENNRRLTSRGMGDAGPTSEALAAAGKAGGSNAPGPIYNYDSPGADGRLSERDLAEQEAIARERAAAAAQSPAEPSSQSQTTPSDASVEQPSTPSADDTVSSSDRSDTGTSGDVQPDAGTAVAGEAEPPEPQQRTFVPAENIEWQWPADGQLLGGFGEGADITAGIDIAGQKGQPVKAAGPGIVVYAGDGVRGYGNLILLKHNDRFLSAYAYNDSLRVQENDVVEAGQVIATMGDSDTDGVKLHFEVRQDGQPQDPLQYLPER